MSTETQGSPSGGAVSIAPPPPRPSLVSFHPKLVAAHRRNALAVGLLGLSGLLLAPVYVALQGFGWLELALFAAMYWPTMGLGLSVGYHRYFSHAAFRAHPAVRWLMAVCGAMAGQGTVTYWAAVHRRHHEHSDEPGDPHSPHLAGDGFAGALRGLWHGHYGWTLSYGLPSAVHYCPDLLRDKKLCAIQRYYAALVALGLALPTIVGALVTRSWHGALAGLLWGGLVRLFVSSNSTWALNSICHRFGRRTYATKDRSGDVAWLALPTLGESWHNSHHALPSAARHGRKWWQLDLNYAAIRAMELCGLASNVQRPRG